MKSGNLKKLTLEELAESYVFKNNVSAKELKEANSELAAARLKLRNTLSDKYTLYAKLLQLRFLMEDYSKSNSYDDKLSFAFFLKQYISLSYKINKEFANDIHLKATELSLILNRRRLPSDKIIVRLELHSNKVIPAISWFRIVEKEKENKLNIDSESRRTEAKFVKNRLRFDLENV